MFFSKFPKLNYKIDFNNNGFGSQVITVDIFRRVAPLDKFIVNELFLEDYVIKAGERPEDVAFHLYGDPEYHWVLLVINNIIDPYNEWYYTPEQLWSLVTQRYGAGNENATHHWARYDNPLICQDYDAASVASGDLFEVTHLEHEQFENDARQNIRVLHPRYLNDFVNEFYRLMKQ